MTIIVLGVENTAGSGAPVGAMDYVAIPPGTVIEVHPRDEGRVYGPDEPLWDELGDPWTTFTCESPACNDLALRGDASFHDPDLLAPMSQFTLMRPGFHLLPDPLPLCDGAPGECPATREDIEEGLEHECGGLLGFLTRYGISGAVYLVIAGSFTKADRSAAGGRGAGQRPQTVDQLNRTVLAEVSDVEIVYFAIGAGRLMLSRDPWFDNHSRHNRNAMQADPGWLRGELTVHQLGPTTMTPTIVMRDPVPAAVQQFMAAAITRVWDHEVIFTSETLYAQRPAPRRTGAARFLQTEPSGRAWEFDVDAAFRVNQRVLKKVSPATGFTDTRNNSELHYRIAGGMLLVSRTRDFDEHADINLQYVENHRDADDAGTGGLFVYLPGRGSDRRWRINAAPDTHITETQQHLLRTAVQKLGGYDVSF